MKRKVISWLLVILWMSLIFYLSHQVAEESSSLSGGITDQIVEMIDRVVGIDLDFNFDAANHIIRKNAHFFIYLVLGVLVLNALRSSGLKGTRAIAFALLICLVYAISDEVHQLFVAGRGGQLKDVVIDSCGSTLGIFIFNWLIGLDISIVNKYLN